jgi:hypothetical protein
VEMAGAETCGLMEKPSAASASCTGLTLVPSAPTILSARISVCTSQSTERFRESAWADQELLRRTKGLGRKSLGLSRYSRKDGLTNSFVPHRQLKNSRDAWH